MGIILDIILILVLALFIFIGYKKGLVKVIFGLVAIVVSLVVTVILYRPITSLVIENTQIDENIAIAIEKKITLNDKESSDESNQFLDKYINNAKRDIEGGIIKSTSEIIAVNIVGIAVGIILYAVIRILVTIVGIITNTLTELPIIKQFNKAGGTLYGVIEGVLIIHITLAILFFIVTANNSVEITNLIETSFITKFLYSNNVILKILF